MDTLLSVLIKNKNEYSDKLAVNQYTYQQLYLKSLSCMVAIRSLGTKARDRIVIYTTNIPEDIIALYGIIMAGCISVLVQDEASLQDIVNDCEAVMVISSKSVILNVPTLTIWQCMNMDINDCGVYPVNEEDIAIIVYTSGSTSAKKGVVEKHRNIFFAASAIVKALGIADTDRILVALPLSFDYGLYQIFMSVMVGAYVYISQDYRSVAKRTTEIMENRITIFPATPPLLFSWLPLIRDRADLSRLRMITSTGEYFSAALIRQAMNVLPHIRVVPMYGLTECKRVSIMPPDAPNDKLMHSVGICLPQTSAIIVGPDLEPLPVGKSGELIVFGEHIMSGYWNKEEETKQVFIRRHNQYALKTGDIMRMDEDGFLYFSFRNTAFLKQNTIRISTKKVETNILKIEGITEACAVNYLDVDQIEKICCFYVGEANEKDMKKNCLPALEVYEVPHKFLKLNALPMSDNMKYDRKQMSEWASNRIASG